MDSNRDVKKFRVWAYHPTSLPIVQGKTPMTNTIVWAKNLGDAKRIFETQYPSFVVYDVSEVI